MTRPFYNSLISTKIDIGTPGVKTNFLSISKTRKRALSCMLRLALIIKIQSKEENEIFYKKCDK